MITTISGGRVAFEGGAERVDAVTGPSALLPEAISVWWGERRMERHALPPQARVWVKDGEDVPPQTVLATSIYGVWQDRALAYGGLECLQAVLHGRIPRRHRPAIIAMVDGVVEEAGPRQVVIRDAAGRRRAVPARGLIVVRAGDVVVAGDKLADGWRSHHRLLRAWGLERLRAHLLEELDGFTRDAPDPPPRVWWSVVVRAMTDWIRVRRVGDSGLRRNAIVARTEFDRVAQETAARGGGSPEGVPVLRGIDWIARRRLKARA
ncbi:MAG: hypothetical protein U0325_14670 [Polyangiales bacterium]